MRDSTSIAARPRTTGRPLKAWQRAAVALAATVKLWRERSRQRQALARLDERQLRDIGITRLEAQIEASKPFWRR